MSIKLVIDSAADIVSLEKTEYDIVPLKVITQFKEYIDSPNADVNEMLDDLEHYKGKSSSSCASVGDWLAAFGDAQEIICITITSNLSGNYNSACIARDTYTETFPERKVFVLDTLSAGPEMTLIVQKAEQMIVEGRSFSEISSALKSYSSRTKLLFSLRSLNNFVNNGRVKPSVAKLTGILGIRLIGRASSEGTLEPLDKARGEKGSVNCLLKNLIKLGYSGRKMIIHHCQNHESAEELKKAVLNRFSNAEIQIDHLRVLCSFYAERGGILVGFETE